MASSGIDFTGLVAVLPLGAISDSLGLGLGLGFGLGLGH